MSSLEWTQSWDDYELLLFIGKDATGQEKIFARVSKIARTEPEVQKELLYERELCLLNPDIIRGLDREVWETKQLRWFLDTHPELAEREKTYLKDWEKKQ